jgi:hypothetical protein
MDVEKTMRTPRLFALIDRSSTAAAVDPGLLVVIATKKAIAERRCRQGEVVAERLVRQEAAEAEAMINW